MLDIHVRPGEKPGALGVLDLGDTENMTVEAEIYQTLIGQVAIGDPVKVFADALAQDLTGTISAIGIQIGRQTITSNDPAANTDGSCAPYAFVSGIRIEPGDEICIRTANSGGWGATIL